MPLGLLGAALSGGGQAVQQNAQSRIKQMHDQAMEKMRQKYQTSERVAGQDFAAQQTDKEFEFRKGERIAGQDFTAGQNQLTREQERELALLRERGANSRAAAGRNDWQMMTSSDGQPIRVNTRTGTIEPMAVPDGISFPKGDSWGERDQAYIDSLQAELSALQEIGKSGMPLSDEQQSRLQQIPQEMRTYAQGIDADGEVMSAYDSMRSGQSGAPPENIRRPGLLTQPQGSETQPSGAREVIQQQEQQQEQQQATRQQTADVRRLASTAKDTAKTLQNFRDYNSGMQMGGSSGEWTQRRQQLRQEGVQQMSTLMEAYNGTEDRDLRDLLMEGMEELRRAGVPLPQE